MNAMTIGKLAAEAGVGVETVRFYEREKLIDQPRRPPSGFRTYDAGAVQRITFIRQAQDLGFSLGEIRELLALRIDPRTSCADVKARAESKIRDVDEKINALRRMRSALIEITKNCSGEGPTSDCPILEALGKCRSSRSQ
jgi:MerR family mercuric resistance operon transcriptional regulator